MKGIIKAAKQANGRSQACATCPLNRSRGVCLPEIQRVCSDAFIEGFKKGVKWLQQKQKVEEAKDGMISETLYIRNCI